MLVWVALSPNRHVSIPLLGNFIFVERLFPFLFTIPFPISFSQIVLPIPFPQQTCFQTKENKTQTKSEQQTATIALVHQFAIEIFEIFFWERTKSFLALQDLNPRRDLMRCFKFKGFQVFYDGSGWTDPIWKMQVIQFSEKGKGFETIPFGSNNIGEFTGCLREKQCARSITRKIEIVGDCMILTKAASKTHTINNYYLNEYHNFVFDIICDLKILLWEDILFKRFASPFNCSYYLIHSRLAKLYISSYEFINCSNWPCLFFSNP